MHLMQSPPSPACLIDGREMLYFVGTGYHCLQGHPAVLNAAGNALRQYGMGSGTSRGRFGTTPPLLDVEAAAAEFFGMEQSFYLPSGYVSAGLIARSLCDRFDRVFFDERTHYAVIDAARACGRPCEPFAHRDPAALKQQIRRRIRAKEKVLVATDGVFPVLGTLAPLREYAEIARRHPGSAVLVDDAHAIGVLGENGRGTLEHLGLWDAAVNTDPERSTVLLCGTLSKAVGGFGGIIPGSRTFVDMMRRSELFNGASALPPAVAAGTAEGLRVLMVHPELRRRLLENAAMLKGRLGAMGLAIEPSPSPIAWLVVGDAANMQRIQQALWDRRIAIDYIPHYAGTGMHGGLRIAVFSRHTQEMIGRLVTELGQVL
ncbi:MAG: aminotransferase class I/II-fold pyridoxal phosphate-dependent enzyme [Tepidisphaerales bacterium]